MIEIESYNKDNLTKKKKVIKKKKTAKKLIT